MPKVKLCLAEIRVLKLEEAKKYTIEYDSVFYDSEVYAAPSMSIVYRSQFEIFRYHVNDYGQLGSLLTLKGISDEIIMQYNTLM